LQTVRAVLLLGVTRFKQLHRIAAVVLLRMLQEAEVARDIAAGGGVVIVLAMLQEHVEVSITYTHTVCCNVSYSITFFL
jgi:hypothetical protein